MLRITLRELWAHKVRLVMSTLAIVLGVAFLAGVLVFTHGISHTFDGIIKGSTPGAEVRAQGARSFSQNRTATVRLHPADIARIRAVEEVGRAYPEISGADLHVLDRHGKLLESSGAPTLAFNHPGGKNLLGKPRLTLHSGSWPRTTSQITLDPTTARKGGYHVGDTVTVLAPGGEAHRRLRLTGIASFSSGSGTAGAQLVVFSTAGAQKMFLGGRHEYTGVALTPARGVSRAELARAVGTVVPKGFEAVSGDQIVAESDDAVNDLLSVITTFLVVFAAIAVIVGGFIIVNTFSILIAQRSRELALLRALGASRRQVTLSVLLQALVMALVAATVGVVAGWGLAQGLAVVSRRFGFDISGSALVLTPRTVAVSYAVGVGITLVAALLPSRRASRVPPVAAMRADHQPRARSMALRTVVGVLLLLAGIGVAVYATGRLPSTVAGHLPALPGNRAIWVGVGAGVSILTVAAISAALGRPVLLVLRTLAGWVFRMPGRLAGENALRDPRRTGATASALMIGLALVSLIGMLAASLNASIADVVDKQFNADFIVSGPTGASFPTSVGDTMARTAGVAEVSRMQYAQAVIGRPPTIDPRNTRKPLPRPKTATLVGIDDATTRIYPVVVRSGTARLGPGDAFVTSSEARKRHWRLGQRLTFTFPGGKEMHPTIVGIIKRSDVLGPVNVRLADLGTVVSRRDHYLSVLTTPGADRAHVHKALDRVVKEQPIASVQDKAEFGDSVRAQVDRLLYMIYGLLALAIVIAVIGIVNTLGLSVVERTRELGLLRAIGLTRAQLRRMITLESVTIAVLGAVLGMALGVLFGILLREALRKDLTSLGLPLQQLVLFLAVSVVVGVLAAVIPGIRAARLDVLRAIATE